MNERRTSPRTPAAGRVYLTFDGRCRTEQLVDLSPTGLGFDTRLKLPPGLVITVFVPLPAEEGQVMCQLKGQVARCQQGRVGVALIPGAKDARHLLRAWLGQRGAEAHAA